MRVCGHVQRPPMGGSAVVKVISGVLVPSTKPRAPASASSLWVTAMRDLTLPMYVVYPSSSRALMMLYATMRWSLCWWWIKLCGSEA